VIPTRGALFFLNQSVKRTLGARVTLLGESSLDFLATAGAGHRPADATRIFPGVYALIRLINRCNAGATFSRFSTTRLSLALHKFPAIHLFVRHFSYPLIALAKIKWLAVAGRPDSICVFQLTVGDDLKIAIDSRCQCGKAHAADAWVGAAICFDLAVKIFDRQLVVHFHRLNFKCVIGIAILVQPLWIGTLFSDSGRKKAHTSLKA
jgi:hypothetical protein